MAMHEHIPSKGSKREWIVDELVDILTSTGTYRDVKRNVNERELKRDLNKELLGKLGKMHDERSSSNDEDLIKKKARESLF